MRMPGWSGARMTSSNGASVPCTGVQLPTHVPWRADSMSAWPNLNSSSSVATASIQREQNEQRPRAQNCRRVSYLSSSTTSRSGSLAAPASRAHESDDSEPESDPVVALPIEDSIDLHGFQPRDIPNVVVDYLEEAVQRGFRRCD